MLSIFSVQNLQTFLRRKNLRPPSRPLPPGRPPPPWRGPEETGTGGTCAALGCRCFGSLRSCLFGALVCHNSPCWRQRRLNFHHRLRAHCPLALPARRRASLPKPLPEELPPELSAGASAALPPPSRPLAAAVSAPEPPPLHSRLPGLLLPLPPGPAFPGP